MKQKRINRQANDDAAFRALVEAVERGDKITLTFPNASQAKAIRLKFYRWRKFCQEELGQVGYAGQVVITFPTPEVLCFARGSEDKLLRSILAQAGVQVAPAEEFPAPHFTVPVPEEPPTPEEQEESAFSKAMKLAGVSAQGLPQFPAPKKEDEK